MQNKILQIKSRRKTMSKGFQGFGGVNMNQIMKQAKKMQEEMTKTQETITN